MSERIPDKNGETFAKIDKALQHVYDICQERARWRMSIPANPEYDSDLILCEALESARRDLSAPSAIGAPRWVPTSERHPDKHGRLWAVLTKAMTDGKHVGYIPLYEYYYFDNGWATDDGVTHWLEVDLHPLPSVPTDGKGDKNGT